jgi:hypothetical protein
MSSIQHGHFLPHAGVYTKLSAIYPWLKGIMKDLDGVDNENEGGGEVESTEEGESEERNNEGENQKNKPEQFWKNLYEQGKSSFDQWLSI